MEIEKKTSKIVYLTDIYDVNHHFDLVDIRELYTTMNSVTGEGGFHLVVAGQQDRNIDIRKSDYLELQKCLDKEEELYLVKKRFMYEPKDSMDLQYSCNC